MKKTMKRGLSLVLALVLIAGMVPHFVVPASAATSKKVRNVTLQLEQGYCSVHTNRQYPVKSVSIDDVVFEDGTPEQKVTFYFSYTIYCDACNKDVTVSGWAFSRDREMCSSGWSNVVLKSQDSRLTVKAHRSATHLVDAWTFDGENHSGNCGFCGKVSAKCFGKHANCVSGAICSTCGGEYSPVNSTNHAWGGWVSDGNYTTHTRTCSRSGEHTETGTCSGGAATCSSYAQCSGCQEDYGAMLPHSCVYALKEGTGNVLVESCTNCEHVAEAKLAATDGVYTRSVATGSVCYDDGWTGEKPTDIHYSNNTGAGTATAWITVEGKKLTTTFAIAPYDISSGHSAVKLDPAGGVYTGQPHHPTVTFGDGTLVEGMDYTAAWSGNLTDVGKYVLTITGKGNYTGIRTVTYEIGKATPAVEAPRAKELAYNGQEQPLVEPGKTGQGSMVYSTNESGPYTTSIPTGNAVGTYTVWYQVDVGSNPNYQNTAPESMEVTIGKAVLTPVITGTVSKVYDGNTHVMDSRDLVVSAGEIVAGEDVKLTADYTYAYADAGENKIIHAGSITIQGENAGNYRLAADTASAPVGRIEPLLLTEEASGTVEPLVWDGTEQTARLTSLKMKGLDVTYELSGNSATDVGVYKMTVSGTGNFRGDLELEFYIFPNEDILDGITESNVTGDQGDILRKAQEMVRSADTTGFPQEQKDALDASLKNISDQAKALEDRLEDAGDAVATGNVEKAAAITGDNAGAEDKKALTDAKADLEAALNTYGTNYTPEETKDITDEIDRLEDILADIATAEPVIEMVEDLPESAAPDNAAAWKQIDMAQDAYDALTDGQKKIVDNSTDGKLAELLAARFDVRLTYISTRTWYKKGSKNLVLTFNGPRSNFSHLLFGGKQVPAEYFSVKDGSTMIILSPSFLTDQNIVAGRIYLVTAVYNFGKNDAGEDILVHSSTNVDGKATEVVISNASSSAPTGDLFQAGLWAGIGGISLLALVALLILMKKKEKK